MKQNLCTCQNFQNLVFIVIFKIYYRTSSSNRRIKIYFIHGPMFKLKYLTRTKLLKAMRRSSCKHFSVQFCPCVLGGVKVSTFYICFSWRIYIAGNRPTSKPAQNNKLAKFRHTVLPRAAGPSAWELRSGRKSTGIVASRTSRNCQVQVIPQCLQTH